jgi:hypothetical protein
LRFVKKADAAEAQALRAAEPIEELKQRLDE